MITELVAEECWKSVQLARGGPQLAQLCFAEDIILFAKADIEQVTLIRRCLDRFCKDASKRVSLTKSSLVISKNTSPHFAQVFNNKLRIPLAENMGKYLGSPSFHKRVSKDTYAEVLERMQSKLQG